MERLSNSRHAVRQAIQAPSVKTQPSISHVAGKHDNSHYTKQVYNKGLVQDDYVVQYHSLPRLAWVNTFFLLKTALVIQRRAHIHSFPDEVKLSMSVKCLAKIPPTNTEDTKSSD